MLLYDTELDHHIHSNRNTLNTPRHHQPDLDRHGLCTARSASGWSSQKSAQRVKLFSTVSPGCSGPV